MKINAASFWSILKTLPFHFFGYKSNIFHPIDMANVLYQTCSLVQEKKYVKLVTNIKNGNTSHENPYFGLRDGGTWKQFKLDKGSWILQIKLVLAYLHRNNKYTMSKTYQKMLEVQFSYFHCWIRSISFPTRIPQQRYVFHQVEFVDKNNLEAKNSRRDTSIPSVSAKLWWD